MGNGKFKIDECTSNPEDIVATNEIMRALGRKVAGIAGIGPWQFRLEDQKLDEESPHYVLCLTSTDGAGDTCAFEKMNTLRNHPDITNTKEMDNRQLGIDEVSWYGGISVRYTGHEGRRLIPVEGVVRIVFSGSEEAVDLGITLEELCVYIDACDKSFLDSTYLYDLDKLRADPLSNYLMKFIFPQL